MKMYITVFLFFLKISVVCSAEPFNIVSLKKTEILSNAILNSLPLKRIKMNYSRAYPAVEMDYKGIRLCDLLKGYAIDSRHLLEFIAKDNFSVLIPAKYALNCRKNASIGYLVIEPESGWPKLFNHTNTTAGPYAVIWTNPERSVISDEYWAWSVTRIVEHKKANEKIVIGPPDTKKKPVLKGYAIYVSHCSSCHTINHKGKASIGPDFTSPNNPLDYYPDTRQLKKFIRNPESVRKLAKGRMSGSSYAGLKDNDLEDLIRYFGWLKQPLQTGMS